MDRQRVLDAVDGIRSIAHEKGKHRRLMPSDLVDIEVYLQQILLETEEPRPSLWDKIAQKIGGIFC